MDYLKEKLERDLLPYVQKPMRYIGNEINIIRKDLSKVSLHGTLCFPEIYEIGMSHYGLQILYHIVNSNSQWALSRCFHPWVDAEQIMRRQKIPLYCLEYFAPVRQSDWIGFSLQYELQLTNLVNMLELAGLSIRSADRHDNDPVVIVGGPIVSNPEPVADFVDACVIGDGEKVIVQICSALEKGKKNGATRRELIENLAACDGIYVPSRAPVVKRGIFFIPRPDTDNIVSVAKIDRLDSAYYPTNPLVPLIDIVHHRLAVEVMRGCSRGCRFCSAGIFYRPVRERVVQSIVSQIGQSIKTSGWREVGLLSLSTADYSKLPELLEKCEALQSFYHINISLPSTRIDALNEKQLMAFEKLLFQSSFTLAPEAGSYRLRKVCNKDFTDQQIFNTVKLLIEKNVQTLKLYFMIGLPTETQEDIDGIIELVTKIATIARSKSGRRKVNVSLSPFSPKPHTPFQWEAMDSVEELQRKSVYIKQCLRNIRNVKVSYRSPNMALVETIIARGDRSICNLIETVWKLGAKFDGWEETFNFQLWEQAANACGIDISVFLKKIPLNQPLPWQAINTGVSAEFLTQEREKAFRAEPTADCRGGNCWGCGLNCHRVSLEAENNQLSASSLPVSINIYEPSSSIRRRYYYRFKYRKFGLARFLSHLDIVGIFQRAFTASYIPVEYSTGYSPHPRLAFGPPLPLGESGEQELLDIVAVSHIDKCEVELINSFLPEGLEIINFELLPLKPISISASVRAGHYRIFIPRVVYSKSTEIISEFLNSEQWIIEIKRNNTFVKKDIRPLVNLLEIISKGDEMFLKTVLSMKTGQVCRPRDLISGLFPENSYEEFRIIRVECII